MPDEIEKSEEEIVRPGTRRPVRIAELGRPLEELFLDVDEEVTIQNLIDEEHLPGGQDVQIFVNNREIPINGRETEKVRNGDMVVAIRKIVAG